MYRAIGIALAMTLSLGMVRAQSDSIAKYFGLEVVFSVTTYWDQVAQNPDLKLVDLEKEIPSLVLDVRYATSNNFVGVPIYNESKAFVRKPVAEALHNVQTELAKEGLGLVIYDAYRPYSATIQFFDTYADSTFVAHPSKGSRHNRGCAVDVTLIDLETRNYLEMPTPFDDFSERAHPDFPNLTTEVLVNRNLLRQVMEKNGFTVYPAEWWHFDFVGWEDFPLMDIPFEALH